MNWFKFAKDFSDRNVINSKIRYLQDLREIVQSNSKVVFQSGKTVKDSSLNIISSSKIVSYPSLHEILIQANSIALDSPWKFEALCNEAIKKIDQLVFALKEERSEITYGEKVKQPKKGWF